jgi:tRNA(Ser,Leu) C12 N-acetylase TAN1
MASLTPVNAARPRRRTLFGMDWNLVVTVQPGAHLQRQLLGALARFGRFRATPFRDVCTGRVDDVDAFLEQLRRAGEQDAPWTQWIARVIPAEAAFQFAPPTLAERLQQAVVPLVARMSAGSFCVRIERRGGELKTQEVERALGEQVHALAAAQGKTMRTDFADPDYVIAIETLGRECGIALLPRALRERYRFVRLH